MNGECRSASASPGGAAAAPSGATWDDATQLLEELPVAAPAALGAALSERTLA